MTPVDAIIGYLRRPIDCGVPDAQRREAEAIVQALDKAGYSVVPQEPTAAILSEIKQAIWKNTWGDQALAAHWFLIRRAAVNAEKRS